MHNSIRVSVVATGIDCPKKVDNVENIISDINQTLEKNNTESGSQILAELKKYANQVKDSLIS